MLVSLNKGTTDRSAKKLDVMAIAHLPFSLPHESSQRFANKMTPYLMRLSDVRNKSLLFLLILVPGRLLVSPPDSTPLELQFGFIYLALP